MQSQLHIVWSRGIEQRLAAWGRIFRFGAVAIAGTLSPSTYNSATRLVVQRQIYFTAWEIFPWFIALTMMLSWLVSSIVVDVARDFGLFDYALEVIIRVLVVEILPFTTALFVALRTGAAINTEVALMKINNELEALRRSGVDPLTYELIPRVIGGTTAVLALTAVTTVVALLAARAVVFDAWPFGAAAEDFARTVGKVLDIPTLLLLGMKTFAFGFAVTVIPIAEALETPQKSFHAPISVLRAMVKLFFAIMFIELGVLALRYA